MVHYIFIQRKRNIVLNSMHTNRDVHLPGALPSRIVRKTEPEKIAIASEDGGRNRDCRENERERSEDTCTDRERWILIKIIRANLKFSWDH